MPDAELTVIVPTLGLVERKDLLRCSIESVLAQERVRAIPLIVFNGPSRSPELERAWRADARVRVLTLDEADIPSALRAARAAVNTPWFATLDDDDMLLPGALALRLHALERHSDCDVVITNGYRRGVSGDALQIPAGSEINSDPLRALLRRNWLLPGSWLCRSDGIGAVLFDDMPPYLECTFLAIRFATDCRMLWLDTPTVVYRVGSPVAVSRSREFMLGQVDALRRIVALPLPSDVRREYRRRIASAYHEMANIAWRDGSMRQAWRWHLASLLERGGWRYLPFMRHLVYGPPDRP